MKCPRAKWTAVSVLDRFLVVGPYAFFLYEVLVHGWSPTWILAVLWAEEVCSWLAGWGQLALYQQRGYPPLPGVRRYLFAAAVFLLAHTAALMVADFAVTMELGSVTGGAEPTAPIASWLLALFGYPEVDRDVLLGLGTLFLVTGGFYVAELVAIAWRTSRDPDRQAPIKEWLAWTSQPLILNHIVVIVAGGVALSGLTYFVWVPALVLLRIANVAGWPHLKVAFEE